LFEPMPDRDQFVGEVDLTAGKKYRIKSTAAMQQWLLQVIKSGQGIQLVPAVDGRTPPAMSEPAFGNTPSVFTSDIKLSGSYIVLWVINGSSATANIVFKEGEDVFVTEPLVASLAEMTRIEEVRAGPLLTPEDIKSLHGDFWQVRRGLKNLLKEVNIVSSALEEAAEKPSRPTRRGRLVPVAPSREEAREKEAVDLVRPQVRIRTPTTTNPTVIIETPPSEDRDGQATNKSTPPVSGISPSKRKVTPVKKRVRFEDRNPVKSPTLQRQLDAMFHRECIPEEVVVVELNPDAEAAVVVAQSWRRGPRTEKVVVLAPSTKLKAGELFDFKQAADELEQFETRMLALDPFGKEKRSKVHVDDMEIAPPDFKYRPFHPRLRDTLICYLTQALNAPKQTFTLMPKEASKPVN
jgi:hypothetical protein